MAKEKNSDLMIVSAEVVRNKIYVIRGQRVMLDADLAQIYGYTTKTLNQQVRRNIEKFEGDEFIFQLTEDEWTNLRSQIVTSSLEWGGIRYRPYAFTEQGIYMLMTVLKGDLAVRQSRALVLLFKQMKDYILDTQGTIGQTELAKLAIQTNENTLSSFTDWTESTNCLVYDPTLPLFENAENGDYTLAKYSQALNVADNSYVETETDLAGNQRIVGGAVDMGAYERQKLPSSVMLTGTKNYYVSYSANRHRLEWEPVTDAFSYELSYSTDNQNWTGIQTEDTSAIDTGLTYGDTVCYRVRALGEGVFIDSDWSDVKSFAVCPMDINNDRAIAGADLRIMATAWLSEEGDDEFLYCADIDGNGDVSNTDRAYLLLNWLSDVEEDDLTYPRQPLANAVFAQFESGNLRVDVETF